MANGDARPLSDIWSHGAAVTAMHPIGGRQVGWDIPAIFPPLLGEDDEVHVDGGVMNNMP